MDFSKKDKFGLEKRNDDHLSHQPPGISADWQFENPSMGLVPANISIAISQRNQMGSSQCPSVSLVDSFPSLWNHSTNSQNLGFCQNDLQPTTSTSTDVLVGKPVPLSSRLDMDWNSSESMCKGAMFLPMGRGIPPPGLTHFPANPTFIEQASRLSCFNGGSFSGTVNPFATSKSLSPYSNVSKGDVGAQIQKIGLDMPQDCKDVSIYVDDGSNSGSPMSNQRDKGSLHVGVLSNEHGESGFNGVDKIGTPDSANPSGDSSSKGLVAKKRKRSNQDMELDQVQGGPQLAAETTMENIETKQKLGQNSILATVDPNGKQAKDSSDAPKEDYIHVRARRGQATNSHSLAERVRREKISERMKYLQDLVPGCSKVMGKAVMLDEIINYVQSLQRQVEFLSMKLAAVNPCLDVNIEGLLSKELQSRVCPSIIGFSPDVMHTQLQQSQQDLVQAGISGMVNPSDALRRAVHARLTALNGYKEPTPQAPNAWDIDLHNVVEMTYGANPPINPQERSGKPCHGFPL